MYKRWFYLALPPLVLVAAAFVLVQLFLELDEDSVDRTAAERLTLYRQTILGEYQKFRYLPYMIARDPRATSALGLGQPVESANRFLQEMAEKLRRRPALRDERSRHDPCRQQLAGPSVACRAELWVPAVFQSRDQWRGRPVLCHRGNARRAGALPFPADPGLRRTPGRGGGQGRYAAAGRSLGGRRRDGFSLPTPMA
ncbi:hypothetical protein QW131_01050 [Roseibium salinum]|nr:hypothetical protein [Roseibium salinum]